MDFWLLAAGFMASAVGLGTSGTDCLTTSRPDVALCFTLTDLLRQGLGAAPGWGMAEEAPLLAGVELLTFSKVAGAFSLIPGWEEAGLANGSAEIGERRKSELPVDLCSRRGRVSHIYTANHSQPKCPTALLPASCFTCG